MEQVFTYPLKQHVGAPAEPIVQTGDTVLRGQMIARIPADALSANLFSSVSGTVREVSDAWIQVTADERQTDDYVKLISKEPLELIRESGIVGLGGAGFPTYAKLKTPFQDGEGVVIVNAAECEPILSHNVDSIEKDAGRLVRGLHIVMDVVRASRGIIAIKDIHETAISRLQAAIDDPRITIGYLPNLYPMGEERAIVRETLGVLLGVDQLPMAAGAIVVNAETVCRVRDAVDLRKPMIDKDMTVAGKLQNGIIKVFHDVPLGLPVSAMFERAGGIGPEYGEIIMGGPFTGSRTTLDAPILKTTGGLIAAEVFWPGPEKLGLLVCACGGNRERLEQIAASMGSTVADVQYCKQAQTMKNGALKCENPGHCPGQVEKVMALKKAGAQALLISNCTDCSNTVMSCAPQLKLPVFHCTDGALRAVNHKLIRRIKAD